MHIINKVFSSSFHIQLFVSYFPFLSFLFPLFFLFLFSLFFYFVPVYLFFFSHSENPFRNIVKKKKNSSKF